MSLLIPRVLFGPYKDVQREAKKMARALHKGESVERVFAAGGFVDQAQHQDALIYTLSYSGRSGKEDAFYPAAPIDAFSTLMFNYAQDGEQATAKARELIKQLLPHAWGVLALTMSDAELLWSRLTNPVREGAPPDPLLFEFLEALAVHWEKFMMAGRVYSSVHGHGEALTQTLNSLQFVAANLGVPEDLARYPGTAYLEAYAIQEKKRQERMQS